MIFVLCCSVVLFSVILYLFLLHTMLWWATSARNPARTAVTQKQMSNSFSFHPQPMPAYPFSFFFLQQAATQHVHRAQQISYILSYLLMLTLDAACPGANRLLRLDALGNASASCMAASSGSDLLTKWKFSSMPVTIQ
uniref:Uncharacterized protein n=1 Tax=Physcomitrium patens TaxID=3218 RepID=A0A2K1KTJ9_PHYPA|nr:hypothetical protein PHYPA_004108 [Physcomitrium patens]